jgi:hypothetical protein
MPDIDHIARPIRDATLLSVLTAENELDESLPVDPMRPANHLKAAEHEPAVTDIFLLLGTSVQTATRGLSLAEPPSELVGVNKIESSSNGKSADAGENLSRVRLGSGTSTVTAIEVPTSDDVLDSFFDVD